MRRTLAHRPKEPPRPKARIANGKEQARHYNSTDSEENEGAAGRINRAERVDQPTGSATLTVKGGTAKPQADQTGEPTEPERTHTRQPSADTPRAKAQATANELKGTNKQAGAGDQPAPDGNARRAHTQPHDIGRAIMPAPRREPKTETKPDITHLQRTQKIRRFKRRHQKLKLKRKKREKKKTPTKQTKNLCSQGGEPLGILICDAFPQIRSPYGYYLDCANFWFILKAFFFILFSPQPRRGAKAIYLNKARSTSQIDGIFSLSIIKIVMAIKQ